jgi:hypothetical protein
MISHSDLTGQSPFDADLRCASVGLAPLGQSVLRRAAAALRRRDNEVMPTVAALPSAA